jgi:hypothetical protein
MNAFLLASTLNLKKMCEKLKEYFLHFIFLLLFLQKNY